MLSCERKAASEISIADRSEKQTESVGVQSVLVAHSAVQPWLRVGVSCQHCGRSESQV